MSKVEEISTFLQISGHKSLPFTELWRVLLIIENFNEVSTCDFRQVIHVYTNDFSHNTCTVSISNILLFIKKLKRNNKTIFNKKNCI